MIKVKIIDENDFDFFFKIKINADNMYWTGHSKEPNYDELKIYFFNILRKQGNALSRKIYIIFNNEEKIGYLYFDPIDSTTFSLSVAILDKYSGKGYAKLALNEIKNFGFSLGYKKIIADIREDNFKSIKVFESLGFKKTEEFKFIKICNLNQKIKMIRYLFEKET